MKLKKIIALAALGCCLSAPLASAEVVAEQQNSIGRKLTVPHIILEQKGATKGANAAIKAAIQSFALNNPRVEHFYLRYEVTAENDSYISLLLHANAYNDGMAHDGKESHGRVINAQTGKVMELKEFVKLPKLEELKERVRKGDMTVYFVDRQQQLTPTAALSLKQLPTEFIVDECGAVYLVLSEQASHATDTPLLKLEIDACQDLYVTKG